MLSIERLTSASELAQLREPWGQLLNANADRNLFLSHEWANTWWQFFGADARMWLLTVKDGPNLVGIAPMQVRREIYDRLTVRMLGFWSNKHTSRVDFIIPARKQEVILALAKYWQAHADEWDVLRLTDVSERSGTLPLVDEALKIAGLNSFGINQSKLLMHLPVTSTWKAYLEQQPRKFRKDLRQCTQRMEKAGTVESLIQTAPDQLAQAMPELFKLNDANDDKETGATSIDREFQTAIANKLCETGHSYCNHYLRLNGEICAGLHTAIHNGVCYGFLTYYDQRYANIAPGRYLMANLLKWCFAETDIHTMDFNGSSRFISDWTSLAEPLFFISACNQKPYSRMIAWLKNMKRRFNAPHRQINQTGES